MTQVVGGGPLRPGAGERPGGVLPHAPATAPVLRALAEEAGIGHVRIVAWRDLEDPEAGGSELHAHRIASCWASAGLDVELRTSAVGGTTSVVERGGYRVVRRSGRYGVFARTGFEGLRRRAPDGDALVEIWNGMPFFSPLWFPGPRVVFLHHVHAEMWRMALPRPLAALGEVVERRIAPALYRGTRVVTLSSSARREIVDMLGLDPARVSVVPPGVDARFCPGGERAGDPLVVAVGRLVPVKRFDLLIRALARVKAAVPALHAVILGDGYDRPRLETVRRRLGATAWVRLPGRAGDAALVDWYRRAWVVASASLREGWGMTLTEAGGCGTPAVATDIAGHRDAVADGETGLLARDEVGLASALSRLLCDAGLRERMGAEARRRASALTWDAAARGTLQALADEACLLGDDPAGYDPAGYDSVRFGAGFAP